jgi:hypothetical protein
LGVNALHFAEFALKSNGEKAEKPLCRRASKRGQKAALGPRPLTFHSHTREVAHKRHENKDLFIDVYLAELPFERVK